MKVKSFLLLGLIVLICSLGVLSLMGRLDNDQEYWRPADVYSALGGSQGSSYSAVSYGSGAYTGADALVVSSSRSMFRHHAAFSYAPAHSSPMTNSQYPIGGTPSYSSKGASALYTTSSATMKSFGGGGNGTAIMSSSSTKKSVAATSAPMAMTVAMPSTSVFAQNTRSINAADAMPTISGDIAMASSYAGIGNTTGGRRISGRKNAADDPTWLAWLAKWGGVAGSDNGDGSWSYGYDINSLRLAYDDYVNNYWDKMWGTAPDFDDWVTWFMNMASDNPYEFGGNYYYWVSTPIGDSWFLLVLALLYVFIVTIRKRVKEV